MISLYPDQQETIDRVKQAMRRSRSILLQSPTGSGKTVLAASIIHGSRNKGTRSMMIVPRKELLYQTAKTFTKYDIPFTYVAANKPFNPYAKTILATTQTLANWVKAGRAPQVDLIVPDEAHFGGEGLNGIIRHYDKSWKIGLSATPERLDGKGLDCWYQEMVCGPTIKWLIQNKRLSDYRAFMFDSPDLSKIKKVAGDYAKGEISDYMEHQTYLIGSAVNHYREHAIGRLGITYTTSTKHSEIVAQAYRDAGIPAMAIDGKTPDDKRRSIIRAYAKRELLQLVNCDLLTFGFDLASHVEDLGLDVTVECMSDLGPTLSLSKQKQKNGRVLRMKDFPALFFDHAGNIGSRRGNVFYPKHGLPDDDYEWSLKGRDKETREDYERTVAVKQCPVCFCAHRPSPVCPQCSHVYEIKYREVEEMDGELTEIDRESLRVAEEKDSKSYMYKMLAVARKNGIKNPESWAARKTTEHMMKKRER